MRLSRTAFQRLALAALVVCLATFAGLRMARTADAVAGNLRGANGAEPNPDIAAPARYEGGDVVLYEQSFPVQPGDRLVVTLSSEDLVVETGPGAAGVTVRGSGSDAEAAFPRRRFSATYERGTLRVLTDPQRDGLRMGGERASYTVVVRVPERMATEVHLASGDARLGDLAGDLQLETASGDVELGRVREASTLHVTAASGDVRAALLDGADVAVEAASGDVEVDRLAARTATLHTASGDVTVGAAGADRFEASTASGDVTVDRLDAGAVTATTASGDITLGLERAAPVEASTGSGSVALGLPAAGFEVALVGPSIEIADALGFQGQRGRRSADGRLGAGGPRLAVSTGSGEITLDRR